MNNPAGNFSRPAALAVTPRLEGVTVFPPMLDDIDDDGRPTCDPIDWCLGIDDDGPTCGPIDWIVTAIPCLAVGASSSIVALVVFYASKLLSSPAG